MSLRFCVNGPGRSDCLCLQASHLIVSYDEHEVNNTFKFGIIYQRFGQVLKLIKLYSYSSILKSSLKLLKKIKKTERTKIVATS